MAVLRKTVTVLFCDVADSTPLGERLDPEVLQRVMSRYHEEMKKVLERHGGTVEKFIGDAVMAVFGIPTVHDDDALRATRAALEMRTVLASVNTELQRDFGVELSVRTGVNTGEVVAGDPSSGQAFATGHAVVIAERLEKAARGGEILLGETTRRLVENAALVEPLETLKVKGKSAPLQAWRLTGVLEGAPPFARRLDAPMVGREREFAELRAAFDSVVEERRCRLITVVGPAGIGKSRLANELLDSVKDEATVLVGRCLPYGEGITYWPIRDIVRSAVGHLAPEGLQNLLVGADDAQHVATRIGGAVGIADSAGAPEETMWAVRRFLEHLAQKRPLIVGFDDLQWGERTFLDLVEYIVGWSRDAPILLLCLARPELLDRHPTWPRANSISLEPLSPPEAEELLELLRGETAVTEELLARITDAAEGNPLFVEQMLAMLTENGSPPTELAIPPSIHALLAARLDRLEPLERSVLERASVIGKEFWRGAVNELSPESERESISAALHSLVRKDFIRPHTSIFIREDGFSFRHILIRDAAYLGLAKETRAELHERYVGWLERTAGERASELDEILGYHLEQAFRYREELGPLGADELALAARAGDRLSAAGRRAIAARGDVSGAATLISRAISLLPDDDLQRRELLVELGTALMMTGDLKRAETVLEEALTASRAAGDPRLEARAQLQRELVRAYLGSADASKTIPEVTARAIPILEEAGDDLGLARAWQLRSEVDLRAGRWGARGEALERALVHARRAGDLREQATLVALLAQALYYGPTPVEEAIARCEQFLEDISGERSLEAAVTSTLGGLHAMRGDFGEARLLWDRARAIYEELELLFRRAARSLVPGTIEMLAADAEAAERELRWGYETLERMGEKGVRATLAAYLAEAIYAQERYDEAERFATLAQENAAGDDLVPQILWRNVTARVLARRGRFEDAEALAREAVGLVRDTDFCDLQGDTLLGLAEVLRAAGSAGDASQLVEEARQIFEAKGNVVRATEAAGLGSAV